MPPDAHPTQRLFRVRYRGPDGRAGFKLTLYLYTPGELRMQAADALGRRVWELDVNGTDEALWLDHRNKTFCRSRGASRLAVVPLAHLPLLALPKLLLGQIPAEPASQLRRTEKTIAFRDARGQVWNGGFENGHLAWWTLLEDGEAITWWRLEEAENVFVDLRGDRELRWREVVAEPLTNAPEPPRIPGKWKEHCGVETS